jgi:hypothetical protein
MARIRFIIKALGTNRLLRTFFLHRHAELHITRLDFNPSASSAKSAVKKRRTTLATLKAP